MTALLLGLRALDIPPEPEPEGWELALQIATPILLGVGALVLVLALLTRWLKARMRSTGEAKVQARYGAAPPLRSSPTALFFGLQSRGRAQLRGNGVLALAPHELWSSPFAGADAIEIPIASILEVDTATSHLGKWIGGRPLLRVRFRRGDDDDVAAWLVDDLAGWLAAIERARADAQKVMPAPSAAP